MGAFQVAHPDIAVRLDVSSRNVDFGREDAQFHRDISYFVFTYPFQRMVLGYLFTAVFFGLVTAALVHYLFGALRVQTLGRGMAWLEIAVDESCTVMLGQRSVPPAPQRQHRVRHQHHQRERARRRRRARELRSSEMVQ